MQKRKAATPAGIFTYVATESASCSLSKSSFDMCVANDA